MRLDTPAFVAGRVARALTGVIAAALVAVAAAPAAAQTRNDPTDQWLPSAEGANWVYEWSNSPYTAPTRERYRVHSSRAGNFRITWNTTDEDLGNGEGAVQSEGVVDYQRTDAGLVVQNWSSTPPPPEMPILCANPSGCGNSLAGTHYLVIWGNRSPVLAEPLLRGTQWNSVGGAGNDVGSSSRYLGTQLVWVPAFPVAVPAAVVESQITQAGAVGDPYGSGTRTVWWVRGVGPVKVEFRHASGETSQAQLVSTDRSPLPAPPDINHLPLNRGDSAVFRWRNSRHMRRSSTQRFEVAEVVNNSARVDVSRVSGPIAVAGSYVFTRRLSGVTNLAANTRAATRARFPALGPSFVPRRARRHFFTPFDLMIYGFRPVLPAFPAAGQSWKSDTRSRDYRTFGVTGRTRVVGTRRVRVPAGTFRALVVESRLRQKGFPFGSGRRTSWFAPSKGLVKLVFRHGDGSVSTVLRVR